MAGWWLALIALLYVGGLFSVAWYGDHAGARLRKNGGPIFTVCRWLFIALPGLFWCGGSGLSEYLVISEYLYWTYSGFCLFLEVA